jgi:hypothetical protein
MQTQLNAQRRDYVSRPEWGASTSPSNETAKRAYLPSQGSAGSQPSNKFSKVTLVGARTLGRVCRPARGFNKQ